MPRKKAHAPLQIHLNGKPVGILEKQSSGAIDFTYDSTWLGWEHAIPVSRSLPLRPEPYAGDRVNAVFENLLPDNIEIRRTIAERVGASGVDAFGLLSSIGKDCVGALQFIPAGITVDAPGPAEGTVISDSDIADLLKNLGRTPLGLEEDSDFRLSLAGAQEKTALLFHKGKWKKPKGSTPTTHILKPALGELADGTDFKDSVENEFLCLLMTRELGLPTAEAAIRRFGDQSALVVTRFDRHWSSDGRLLRLPQEDCCQALAVPPARKYEAHGGPSIVDILRLLGESDTPQADQFSFLKAQIVFWMIGAIDGHAKNFSLFLNPGGRFHMTPLYDVLSVWPIHSKARFRKNQIKMAMAVGNSRHYKLNLIFPRHFVETALKAGLSPSLVDGIFDDLISVVPSAVARVEKALPMKFPSSVSEPILEALTQRVKLLQNSPRL